MELSLESTMSRGAPDLRSQYYEALTLNCISHGAFALICIFQWAFALATCSLQHVNAFCVNVWKTHEAYTLISFVCVAFAQKVVSGPIWA